MNDERFRDALEAADDRIVAGRAADGDTAAFAVLVRRYAPMMLAYARRVLPGTTEADDVVQDAFLTAWQHLAELEDPGKVRSWLMRITSRKAVDRLRATRPHVSVDDVEPTTLANASPHHITETRAGVDALRDALRDLPAPQRECWVLREMGGYAYDEIAEQLGLPVSTVRGLIARARKYIIVRMEQWR